MFDSGVVLWGEIRCSSNLQPKPQEVNHFAAENTCICSSLHSIPNKINFSLGYGYHAKEKFVIIYNISV